MDKLIIRAIAIMLLAAAAPVAVFAANLTPTAQPDVSAAAAPVSGQKAMTYDDCYNLAAEKNRDYKMAKLDMAIAEAQLGKAAASFGPTLSVMGGYEPIYKSSLNIPGFSVPGFTSQNYYNARLSLNQPLFTFGKLFFGYKMAEEGYRIARIKFKQSGEKLKLDVISSFYGAMIAQEMAATMQETVKANEEYLRITKTKYSNGQASNFDVLQAKVQHANSVPDAQKAADGAKLALQLLKNTLGMQLGDELVLSGSPEYKKLEMSYADIRKKFSEKNDDRDMVESAASIADYGRHLAEAVLLPNIFLSLNYTYASANRDFRLNGQDWSSGWDGTIGFQWTFYDGFKAASGLKEAIANDEKAKLSKEGVENMLEIQLDQLYTTLDQSGKVIEAADDLIKVAEEGYRIAKESYKNGLIQSVDLLNAETGMLRAKMNYLSAMLNYTTTVEKLKNFIE